jgi:NDP-4-keto-2,6-dideoxyhexose 3-C-methyltransferase
VANLQLKVRHILDRVELPEAALIVDIGANDGTALRAYPSGRIRLVGVDPKGARYKKFYPEHIELIPQYFSADVIKRHFGSRKASIVTTFWMFSDLPDPQRFAKDVADILADEGLWALEEGYLPTLLERNAYDNVCHEHLEYYALRQIDWLARRAGLKIIDVEFGDVYGGSFLCFLAKSESAHVQTKRVLDALLHERNAGLDSIEPFAAFGRRAIRSRAAMRAFFDEAASCGKSVAGLGASSRGNVLLQFWGVTKADIKAVGDANPDKYGCWTPGSLLPIVSEDDVLAMNPDYLVVLPWHFRNSILRRPALRGETLVFPLPELEIVRSGHSHEAGQS